MSGEHSVVRRLHPLVGHEIVEIEQAQPSSLSRNGASADAAVVCMRSGRRFELEQGPGGSERVTVRSESGEVVLRVLLTDRGPVLSFESADLVLESTRSLHVRAEDVSIQATNNMAVAVGGHMREHVALDRHASIGGAERLEAASVELQANASHVSVRSIGAIALNGEHIGLNDDPAPEPFAWSAIAEEDGS